MWRPDRWPATLVLVLLPLLTGAAPHAERFGVGEVCQHCVRDRDTGLLWERAGAAVPQSWEAAAQRCAALRTGGRFDWRLPGVKELMALIDERHYKPAVYPALHAESGLYWSATRHRRQAGLRWTVNFSDGHVHAFDADLLFFARCVSG